MSEFGGLWKHENNQHPFVPPKTECGCPSGGGINNGHISYPLLWRNVERKKEKKERKERQKYFNVDSLKVLKRFLRIASSTF